MTVQATPEQTDIIEAVRSRENLLISALAGTGKTTTLSLIARAYPERKALYLAYNKNMQLDAERLFPRHVTCKTIHALAYQAIGHQYKGKLNAKLQASEVMFYFKIKPLKDKKYLASNLMIAASSIAMIRVFCYSAQPEILPEHYSRYHVKQLQNKYENIPFNFNNILSPKTFIERFVYQSLEYARLLWEGMVSLHNTKIPATHDLYLKLYQLSEPDVPGVDYIMLDEAQDANPVILDILSRQKVQRIYVGDSHQQIYGYRGTIDAMSRIQGRHLYLTQSFRFGEAIADKANRILEKAGASQRIKGDPRIHSRLEPVDKTKPYTFISRSNAEIFQEILQLSEQNRKVAFVGDVNQVVHSFESAYYLFKGNLPKVTDYDLKKFMAWTFFKSEAIQTQDQDYLALMNFVEMYQDRTPDVLEKIRSVCQFGESEADVIVTTAHKAKGRQWDQVLVNHDFKYQNQEELNIFYVALTRAVSVLDLSRIKGEIFISNGKEEVLRF